MIHLACHIATLIYDFSLRLEMRGLGLEASDLGLRLGTCGLGIGLIPRLHDTTGLTTSCIV